MNQWINEWMIVIKSTSRFIKQSSKLPDFHMIFFSSLLPHPPSTPPFPLYNPHIGILMAGFQKVASLLRFHCHSGDGLGPYLAGEDSPHCVIVTQGFVQPTYVHTQHTHTC